MDLSRDFMGHGATQFFSEIIMTNPEKQTTIENVVYLGNPPIGYFQDCD